MRSEAIEAGGFGGLRLCAEFVWRGDRFGHVISVVEPGGASRPLLESVEGTPADDWPPGPPLQSLSGLQLPDGRPALLLVGMAGGSHWSASVEPVAGAAELLFDIACRHSRQPAWLGSRYLRLAGAAERIAIRGERADVEHDEEGIAIKPAVVASSGTARWRFAICLNPEP